MCLKGRAVVDQECELFFSIRTHIDSYEIAGFWDHIQTSNAGYRTPLARVSLTVPASPSSIW